MSTAIERIKRRQEMIKLKGKMSYRQIGRKFKISHETARLILDPEAEEKSRNYKIKKRKEKANPLKDFKFDLWKQILVIKLIHPEVTQEQIASYLEIADHKVSTEMSLIKAFLERK